MTFAISSTNRRLWFLPCRFFVILTHVEMFVPSAYALLGRVMHRGVGHVSQPSVDKPPTAHASILDMAGRLSGFDAPAWRTHPGFFFSVGSKPKS